MKRIVKILTVIGLLYGFQDLLAASQVVAASFDGSWGVTRTGRGCTPKRYITIRIKGKRISGSYMGGTGRHILSGSIKPSGSFHFTAKSPRDRVSFSGRISGRSGSGSWRVSGRSCSGSLRVSR